MPTAYASLDSTDFVTGTPVDFETFRAVIDNPTAITEGASGAPRVKVPDALRTDETSTAKRLRPDGLGGVEWVSDTGFKYDAVTASAAAPSVSLTEGDIYEFTYEYDIGTGTPSTSIVLARGYLSLTSGLFLWASGTSGAANARTADVAGGGSSSITVAGKTLTLSGGTLSGPAGSGGAASSFLTATRKT